MYDNIYDDIPTGVEIIGGNTNPTLKDLNQKAVKTLYDLLDGFGSDKKDNPAMVTAVTDAIAKLNTSLKGSNILPKEESEEERVARETADAIKEAMKG